MPHKVPCNFEGINFTFVFYCSLVNMLIHYIVQCSIYTFLSIFMIIFKLFITRLVKIGNQHELTELGLLLFSRKPQSSAPGPSPAAVQVHSG